MKIGHIYIIRNSINQKVYIGQTTTSVKQRWQEHLRHAKVNAEQVISRAMYKHGKENFSIETLEICSKEVIDEREIYYIDLYDSIKNGYNVSIGGQTYKAPRKHLEVNQLIYLYSKEKWTLQRIANKFGVTRYIVTTELRNAGVRFRNSEEIFAKFNKINPEQLIEALNNTKSIRQAADYLNTPYSTFRKACLFHHIEYNSSTSAQHPF